MSLLSLAWHFFVLSLVAFGAATSVVPELHRILVDSAQVMTDDQFAGLFAMSQAAPGTNVMFVTVLGWQVLGLWGAVVSTLAFCSPTAILALTVERVGTRHHNARWHIALRRSLAPITVGLLLSTGYLLGREAPTIGGISLALATTAVLTWTRLTPLLMTALGGLLGALGFV
ncbi:MAG: chromate transporter [Myxococcota bacterium]